MFYVCILCVNSRESNSFLAAFAITLIYSIMNNFSRKTGLFCVAILSLFAVSGLQAQQLSFRKDGSFKIVQFTDVHYCVSKPESKEALAVIAQLWMPKPDLVIFTGDIVTEAPAKNGWDVVTEAVSKRGIPFAVTLGNHDDEQDLSRAQVARLVASYLRACLRIQPIMYPDTEIIRYQSRVPPRIKRRQCCIAWTRVRTVK